MSYDYSAYAKTKKRSIAAVRAAAVKLLPEGQTLVDAEEDTYDELRIAGLGGPITIAIHSFGVQLTVDTTNGGRENFEALGELANEICSELGELLDEDEAAELIEAEQPPEPADLRPHSIHVNRALISLRGHAGEVLAHESMSCAELESQCPGGMLRDNAPGILGEEGRLAFRGKTLECVLHDDAGRVTVRWIYDLDGYGRIRGKRVS